LQNFWNAACIHLSQHSLRFFLGNGVCKYGAGIWPGCG